ncbi:MAG: hypothetical protein II784_00700 [Oscillospiraceae bacterium]|nr:hypothetical protein [Oscillospiraceae bacterium]
MPGIKNIAPVRLCFPPDGQRRDKLMKKWTAAVLCILIVLSAAGCAVSPGPTEAPAESGTQAEESAEAPAESPSAEPPEEAPAESSAAETPEEVQTSPDPEAEKERIVGNAFRFTVPADWEEQADGSYSAVGGSVIISFYAFPFTTGGYSMPEGIKVKDAAFPEEFVKLLNEYDKGSWTYSLYADKAYETAGGLDNRFMLINTRGAAGSPATIIMSAYDWNDEQVFAIMLEYGIVASGYAEDCWETINRTLERIG